MPQVILANYNPPLEGARGKITYANTEVEQAGNGVSIILGASVPLRRQSEIKSAIWLLRNGIRERNLLELDVPPGYKGAALNTVVNIDNITTTNRRTSSTLAGSSFAATDIAISMGNLATDHQMVMMFDTAIEMLTNVLFENIKDQQAA